jgi:Fic family protein
MKIPEKPPYLSKNYNYSTVLGELIDIGKLEEFFELRDSRYYYWDKWKPIAESWKYDSKKLWFAVKTGRISSNIIKLSHLEKFVFEIRIPAMVQRYLHEFDLNLGGSLQGDNIIPSQDRERYLISSLMEEAIASSQLEGAATTRKVAKEMLESNRKPRNHSEQMILNNYVAMKWIVRHTQESFTIQNIQHLHSILTQDTLSNKSEEGTFRKDDDIRIVDTQTGSTLYTPPSFDQLERLMEDFCNFGNDKDKTSFFVHPITKGIILHFLIGYIHPFTDGNGRTARTVFYWYLLKKGYWLIEYMSVSRIILGSKSQYARAYLHTELDGNDLTYFLIYNLKAIHNALEDLKKYIHRKNAEKQNVILLLRNTSFNDRQINIIQELIQDPTTHFNVQQIQIKFNVSNQTARNDLNILVEQEILQARKNGHKIQFLPAKNYMKKLGIK